MHTQLNVLKRWVRKCRFQDVCGFKFNLRAAKTAAAPLKGLNKEDASTSSLFGSLPRCSSAQDLTGDPLEEGQQLSGSSRAPRPTVPEPLPPCCRAERSAGTCRTAPSCAAPHAASSPPEGCYKSWGEVVRRVLWVEVKEVNMETELLTVWTSGSSPFLEQPSSWCLVP